MHLEHQPSQLAMLPLLLLIPPCRRCCWALSHASATLQIIGCVGSRMRSHSAHQLLLGIMVTQLDREPAVRMLAAEVLLGEPGQGLRGLPAAFPGPALLCLCWVDLQA
jgi:hypothetical protein